MIRHLSGHTDANSCIVHAKQWSELLQAAHIGKTVIRVRSSVILEYRVKLGIPHHNGEHDSPSSKLPALWNQCDTLTINYPCTGLRPMIIFVAFCSCCAILMRSHSTWSHSLFWIEAAVHLWELFSDIPVILMLKLLCLSFLSSWTCWVVKDQL